MSDCARCGEAISQSPSAVNRAKREGRPLYCNRACAGLARRLANPPTETERKEAKRLYDDAYRERNAVKRGAQKAAYYQRTRDPAKEAVIRAARMPLHVAYCRRPDYRVKKHAYDKERYESDFGDYVEALHLLQELETEIRSQASAYEIRVANGYYTRNAQKRRRELWQLQQRN